MSRATTRSTPKSKAPRLSRPVAVAEEIKKWVVAENMIGGDRLPSETELIKRFGMSKGTIREAMRILEAQGLIRTRTGPGGGSFVHEVAEDRARALLWNYFYFKDLSMADIYQLRIILEPELAASVAGKLTEDQLAELEGIVARYAEPPKSQEEERDQHVASLQFHQHLASCADNVLLGFLVGFMARMLSDITVKRRLYEPTNLELWERGRDCHLRLIDALRRGRAGEARKIMTSHMKGAASSMEKQEDRVERMFLAGH